MPAAHLRRVRSVRVAGEGGATAIRRRSPRSRRTTPTSPSARTSASPTAASRSSASAGCRRASRSLVDLWQHACTAAGAPYTTITTWHNKGKDVDYQRRALLLDQGPRVREVPRSAAAPAAAPFELAVGVDDDAPAAARRDTAGGSAARSDLSASVDRLSRLHPALARRVHRGARPVRAAAHRLVQRPQRLLPGGRAAGDHRRRPASASSSRPAAACSPSRPWTTCWRRSTPSRATTTATAAPRARSPTSISAPSGWCGSLMSRAGL